MCLSLVRVAERCRQSVWIWQCLCIQYISTADFKCRISAMKSHSCASLYYNCYHLQLLSFLANFKAVHNVIHSRGSIYLLEISLWGIRNIDGKYCACLLHCWLGVAAVIVCVYLFLYLLISDSA